MGSLFHFSVRLGVNSYAISFCVFLMRFAEYSYKMVNIRRIGDVFTVYLSKNTIYTYIFIIKYLFYTLH